ncbi:Fe(3+)-citrate-binding protein YfmC precursor [compost metagenome]
MKRIGSMVALMASILLLLITTACSTEGKEQTSSADKQRVVDTVKGQITIPANPQRIIGTTVTYPDFLYTLDVIPVAAENYHEQFASYFQGAFKDVNKLGSGASLDFEKVLAAAPDLIIAPAWRDESNYDQLTQIAPTVLLENRDDWRDELRDIAKVLNVSNKAEQAIQNYEQKIKEAKERLHTLIGDETVVYMRITPKGSVISGPLSGRGKVIHEELGLKPVDAYPKDEAGVEVSLEVLPEYNPDHFIVQIDGGGDGDQATKIYETMADSTLWKNLKAVKNGHVYFVGDNEWFNFGFTPVANMYAFDQIISEFEKK